MMRRYGIIRTSDCEDHANGEPRLLIEASLQSIALAADRLVSADLRGRLSVIGWNGQAVGCYIVHEKIVRAIHQKLYVIF